MDIEYEAKFPNIIKDDIRARLSSIGAVLVKPEFLQKRCTFNLPKGHEIKGGWVRVRDEGDRFTMSLKVIDGKNIEDQREVMLKIDNFANAVIFLNSVGLEEKSYQETKRELWTLDGTDITIDEWPYIEPFVEVEGKSEEIVREVSQKIGFKWEQAVFGSVHLIASIKYGVSEEILDNEIPRMVFDGENPYLKWKNEHPNYIYT